MKLLLRLFASGRRKEQREKILAVANDARLAGKVRAKLIELEEARTGKKLGAIDFAKLLELFLKYAPQILAFIMTLV